MNVRSQAYLDTLIDYEKVRTAHVYAHFKLERMSCLLSLLGQPQQKFISVHVVGTKGKGSTANMIAALLQEQGFCVGLYTSPHLFCYYERIQINGVQICEPDLWNILHTIKKVWTKAQEHRYGGLTFFEVLTAAAFVFFAEKKVHSAVLEAGLGGRLDATRLAQGKYCAVTKIGKDHMDLLGSSLTQIAREKAAIIRSHQIVVSAPQSPVVARILKTACVRHKAMFVRTHTSAIKPLDFSCQGQRFDIKTVYGNYPSLFLPLLGAHQRENSVIALRTGEMIRQQKIPISVVRKAFARIYWPGRFHIIKRYGRTLVLDGAQNVASLLALEKTFHEYRKARPYRILFGASSDKDFSEYQGQLFAKAKKVIITTTGNPRTYEPWVLRQQGISFLSCPDTFCISDLDAAWESLCRGSGPHEIILVTGSLYLVASVLSRIYGKCKTKGTIDKLFLL